MVNDGMEAVDRETGRDPMPIIALTAHAIEGEKERSQEAGCSLYLSKPVRKQEVLEVLQQIAKQTKVTVPSGTVTASPSV